MDKRVSIATIFAIFVQFVALVAGGVWFAGEFKAQIAANLRRIDVNERTIENLKAVDESLKAADASIRGDLGKQAVALGRIEVNIEAIKDAMEVIAKSVDRNEQQWRWRGGTQ